MKLVVFTTILVLVQAKPNGLYHEEYNYKSSSSSFRNNELQHQKDDEGYYSKHGDLEGRIQPKVNAREQHSEYVNPRLKSLGYTGGGSTGSSSSYGQMQAGQHYENVFQNGMFNQYQPLPHSGNSHDYGIQSNLRQISTQVQQQLAQQLHEAIMNRYRQTTAYSAGLTQAQIDTDRRLLEEELRRNVSLHLQDALQTRYGMQGVRGGLSYSLTNGHLGSVANYNNQELADLTRQLENDLVRQLNEGVRSYYHTSSSSSHRVTSVKQQHHNNNDYNYQYPGNLQVPRQPLHPLQPVQPLPLPARVDYGPVVPNPDSLTTIATRVQHDLNEHLNRILEDTKHRYFSTQSIHHLQNYDHILQQLKEDLRHNVTHQFELQLQHQPQQRFNIDDLENYKRQIENHLITRLIRDFNQQRDNYLSTTQQQTGYELHSNYYPNRINQEEWSNLQRQLRDDMSRQLQLALMQQQQQRHYQHYGGNIDNFNYNALLQQLTDELNRNLTQQIEYRLRQHYGSSLSRGQQYDAQMAQLRNVLENDLQQQLRHGLQQYSQHYSWSSSSSTSSAAAAAAASQTGIKNYRPVRGFETFSLPLNNPDCMMGDDPSVYQEQQNDGLLQKLEDFTDDVDDLTQQLVDDDDHQKLQKSQKLEDLDDQQQAIFPQSTRYSHHHQHYSNHLTSSSVPRVRFVKKYYITDSDGSRKQVDEAQFVKNLEISQHISSDSRGNLKFFIADNFGHNVEIKPGQQLQTIEQVFHKWLQELLHLQTDQSSSINQKFYIEDRNGERKLLTFDEFQEYLKKFRTGNLQMTYKFYQTDNNGVRTEINPYTVNLIGHSLSSQKYYVIDSDGKRREINATEYQRLLEKPQTFITRTINQRYYRIDSQGKRHEITQDEYNRSKANQQVSDDDLKSLEPGFETQPQIEQNSFGSQSHINRQNQIVRGKVEFGQEIDDSDLTQQVQQPDFRRPHSGNLQQQIDDLDLTQQVQQPDFGRPQSGNLQQQTEDLDVTQQVQQSIFNRPQLHRRPSFGNLEFGSQQHNQKPQQPSGKLQNQLEFGQEIDDSDLTQQVQQPHSGKLQEIDDIDLTQQVQQPDFGRPQSGNLQQRPEFGQQIDDDDDDLTQQVQQPNYELGSQYRQKPKPSQLGQEIVDSDLTQQVQQPDFGKPQSGNLQQRPEFGQQQQIQQPGFNRRPNYGGLELGSQYRQKPKPTEFGQEIDDSDLTQQVQQPDFGKPQSGNLQQEQTDDLDLTQQVQQPADFGSKPTSGKLRQFGQQTEDLDLTQQVQQPDFGRPQSGNLQQQETDDLDLTQQVQQPHSGKLQRPEHVFNKPQLHRRPSYGNLEFGSQHNQKPQQPSGKLQNQLEFGQEIDDSHLTQQVVQQPDFGRPTSGKLQQPEFGRPIDDSDLTQQVQQPDFGRPQSGNLQQRPEGDDDLTQQVQQPNYGGLELGSQYRQKPKPTEFGQEIDDSDLTQQVQQPDFGKPQTGNLQQRPEFGQQQVQQPGFNRRPSYGDLEINSLYRRKPKPTEFGQEIDDSDLTQQVQQPDFGKPQSGNLQQQTDDLDVTQQVQQPADFGSKPTSGKLEQFGQQTEDLDLTQQVQQPDFGRPQLHRKPNYGRFEIGSYHQQSGKLQQPQEFGQQIDESDQQVQQHVNVLGTAQDLAQKDLDFKQRLIEQTIGQPIEPQIATGANQHLQEFGQQIDVTQQVQQPSSILGTAEDLARKDLEFKQRLIGQPTNQQEAEQTSQQLIDALRQHVDNNHQTMAYKPRPVYGVIDIDNHQTLVPVGTTRHLSHNSQQHDPLVSIDAHLKPTDSHIGVQTPLGTHGIGYGDHYDGSSYGGSVSSYSSGPYYNHNSRSNLHVGGWNNQKQSDDIETPGVVATTHTGQMGLKTRVINQNQIHETTTEEEEQVTTTTEQPGFFRRLGSKVRNKVTSIF